MKPPSVLSSAFSWTGCVAAASIALSACNTTEPLFGKKRDKDKESEEQAEGTANLEGDTPEASSASSTTSLTPPKNIEMRVAAASATPFFDSLETRSDGTLAKPSRYLNRGTQVGVIEHDRESGFSRVSLPDGSIGYIPSRLLFKGDVPLAQGGPNPSQTDSPEAPELDAEPGATAVRPPSEAPSVRIPEPNLLPPGDE